MTTYVFPKLKIDPIVIPLKLFIDRLTCINAYMDMNPSMNIDSNGNVVILIRSVNYRKFTNNLYASYEIIANSIYTIMNGTLEKDEYLNLDNFTFGKVIYNNTLPFYPTCWTGMEDVRFISPTSLLTTIPELNTKGIPSLFKAELTKNTIHSFVDCEPNIQEKNWMPYIDKKDKEMVIYSLSPFIIKSVIQNDMVTIPISKEMNELLNEYHGSTNGIQYVKNASERLFLIHKNKEMDRVYHRWLLFNVETNEVKVSNEFVFFTHSYIEFPVSLCIFHERIFVSMGVNDDKAYIIELRLFDIESFLSISNEEKQN
jgi:hypothetical protein